MTKKILILILAAFCLTGCDYWFECDQRDRQVLLVYMAGNNDLTINGQRDYRDMLSSYLPSVMNEDRILLVFRHFADEKPVLNRLCRDTSGNAVEELIREYPVDFNSATGATLAAVLADAERAYPADRHGIVLWSHSSGFLPSNYDHGTYELDSDMPRWGEASVQNDPYAHLVKSSDSVVKSFGTDRGSVIEINDLKEALGRYHYDFILFDSCQMGNVEVAYELKDCCDYLVFSPSEILSDGFPYPEMIHPIFTLTPREAMLNICKSYMAFYRTKDGIDRSACIAMVKTSGLEKLADACRPIFRDHHDEILSIDRSPIQRYFRCNEFAFYDIDDFVGRVADEREYRAFAAALNDVVVFKDATDYFFNINIEHYSGLSIYIPRANYTYLNNYYRTLQWNQATELVQ